MDTKKTLLIAGSFTLGFVLGAAVASVLTPWSGEEVRSKLKLSSLPPNKKLERLKKLIEEIEKELASEKEAQQESS